MDHEERKLREDSCVPLNEKAWNDLAYEAWCAKYGNPCEVALKIMKIPEKTIGVLLEEFGELKGKKVANLMGSHGMKALALARLGAEVTVIDFSEGNKRYAEELSGEMKPPIHYVLSNVTEVPDSELTGDYDIVFAEMGILHYFSDLSPFLNTVEMLLKKGGVFVLRDFHPVTTKLISSRGTTAKIRKHKVDGDYFNESLVESEVSYGKYLPNTPTQKVFLRKWTLGEIVTAVSQKGLRVLKLKEEPNQSSDVFDKGIPKTYILTADKL